MKFCSDCFKDSEIRDIIDSISNEDLCDILGTHSNHIYDTKKHSDLVPYFESLLNIYTPISEISADFDRAKALRLKYDLKENWDIFCSSCSHEHIYNLLKNVCAEKYEESPELFNEDVIIEEMLDESYKREYSLLKTYNWDDFTKSLIQNSRFHSSHLNLNILKQFCSSIKKTYKIGEKFYRGRLSSKNGLLKEEMGAPPFELSRDGRANAAGIKCLYLASEIETTINEVRAGVFDYLTIGTFTLKKDITVVDLKRIDKISPFALEVEGIDLVNYAINKQHLNKINQEMGKVIRKSDSKLDYIPTQYICDYIKSICADDSSAVLKYSGIEYNSTLCSIGYNLAIFDPDLFDCTETAIYKINSLTYDTNQVES